MHYNVKIFYYGGLNLDTLNILVSENLKRIRQEKKLSLGELAKLSDVSKSMLAQIERGEGNPTLSTLWKIANGMQIPFNNLMIRPKLPYKVIRLSDIDPILDMKGKIKNYPIFPDDGNQFNVYHLELAKDAFWHSEAHLKNTIEFIMVTEGNLEIRFEEQVFQLKKGENIWFKADVPHSYYNLSNDTTVFQNILYNK